MSVIQKIRDKYARWAVVAIALSLLGFIMMDAFAGRGSIFSGQSTTVGKINGKKIDYQDFAKKVEATEKFKACGTRKLMMWSWQSNTMNWD
jgi:peptidyl-prolyl cis-trans isomerase D